MARPKLELKLSAEQLSELNRLIKAPSTPQKMVLRARIGVLAAEGKDNDEIAMELGTSRVTVGMWRQRILDGGLSGLEEAPRPGRPVEVEAAQVRTVLTKVVQPPPRERLVGAVAPWHGTADCRLRQCNGCGPQMT